MQADQKNVQNRDRRIFAIGDVHGCARELEALLMKLNIQKEDLVVFLGDYVDRGPDSRQVVETVIRLKERCEVVALKGNHEAMFLDFLEHPESPGAGLFVLNGGTSTLANYAGPEGSIEMPQSHVDFFRGLKLSYETEKYFFVHAGVPNQPLSTLDEKQHELHMLWSRYPFLNSHYPWEKVVVHGHTPVREVDVQPNRINLDTGCVYDGKLTAMEFPGRIVHQVEKLSRRETALYPKDPNEPARISMRFSGKLPVSAGRKGERPSDYETLNYNQFGLLMRDVNPSLENDLKIGDRIQGVIGSDPASLVYFDGEVVRTDSKGSLVVYGVRIDELKSGDAAGSMSGPNRTAK